jgi:hypothetical protein
VVLELEGLGNLVRRYVGVAMLRMRRLRIAGGCLKGEELEILRMT